MDKLFLLQVHHARGDLGSPEFEHWDGGLGIASFVQIINEGTVRNKFLNEHRWLSRCGPDQPDDARVVEGDHDTCLAQELLQNGRKNRSIKMKERERERVKRGREK